MLEYKQAVFLGLGDYLTLLSLWVPGTVRDLAKDPINFLTVTWWFTIIYNFSSRWINTLFWTLWVKTQTRMHVCRHTQCTNIRTGKSFIHIKNIPIKLKWELYRKISHAHTYEVHRPGQALAYTIAHTYICIPTELPFFLFLRQGFSVAFELAQELAFVDQAGVKLTDISLPLPPEC